ncbi:MAG: MFS transporter [Ilumatobacteraceae bacterium]
MGDGMVVVAFPLLASRLTSDPRAIAGVVVAATLPDLAAVLLGAVVDRVDRRRLAASAELARAVMPRSVSQPSSPGSATLVLLYGVAFLIGLGRTLTETTAQTILPQIVPNSQLGRANGLLFSTETASEHMLGQALGGLALAAALALPFAVDGITFALSGTLLVFAVPAGVRALESEGGESLRRTIADGFQFVRTDRTLRLVTALIIGFAFCQAAATSTLVLYLTVRSERARRGSASCSPSSPRAV